MRVPLQLFTLTQRYVKIRPSLQQQPSATKNKHLSGLRSQRSNKMVILLTHFTLFVCLVYSIRPHGTWIA